MVDYEEVRDIPWGRKYVNCIKGKVCLNFGHDLTKLVLKDMNGDDDNLDGDGNLSLKRILRSCSLSLSCAILSGAPPFQIEMVSDILSFSCFL